MKNQYFGDVNDFRKYGLLRALAGAGLSIGVCWLLTSDDTGSDGELRKYLTKPSRWRHYDAELYDGLQRLQQPDVSRIVRNAEEWSLVPGATYFHEELTDENDQRNEYFSEALRALRDCNVIFFDPDNGIEVQSPRRGNRGSAKYIYWEELRTAYANGHSLLVYQHFPRVERARFVPFLADRLRDAALEKAAETVQSRWSGQINVWPQIRVAVGP